MLRAFPQIERHARSTRSVDSVVGHVRIDLLVGDCGGPDLLLDELARSKAAAHRLGREQTLVDDPTKFRLLKRKDVELATKDLHGSARIQICRAYGLPIQGRQNTRVYDAWRSHDL